MTDFDLLIMSLGLNAVFLGYILMAQFRIQIMSSALLDAKKLMDFIADGKAMPKRDSQGNIRFKDIKNEKDKPSTPTV